MWKLHGLVLLRISFYRAAAIFHDVLWIALSVSEGTGFRQNRPLADAQGYPPPTNTANGYRWGTGCDVGQPILAAAAFRGGSALDPPACLVFAKTEASLTTQRCRLKGGCSQDWLPHVAPKTGKHPCVAARKEDNR